MHFRDYLALQTALGPPSRVFIREIADELTRPTHGHQYRMMPSPLEELPPSSS